MQRTLLTFKEYFYDKNNFYNIIVDILSQNIKDSKLNDCILLFVTFFTKLRYSKPNEYQNDKLLTIINLLFEFDKKDNKLFRKLLSSALFKLYGNNYPKLINDIKDKMNSIINDNNDKIVLVDNNKFLEVNNQLDFYYNMVNEIIKIKNKYLIKFGDLFDNYKNLSSNLEWIKVEYKNNFLNIINNILKSFKEYNKLIMYKFNSRDILSLDTWSKSLKTFYDICNNIIQCQKIIIEEIIITKNNNIELHKKLRALESKLNSYNEDIKEKNKDIIQNETNNTENNKSKTSKNENKCNNESKYILTIYNLKKEIKDLCQELNRSKSDKNTINEFKMKLNSLNEDIKQSKNNDEENQIKNKEKIAFLMQYNSELKEEINELQNEIDELKSKESKYIDKIIILENKCSHFNKEINEKNKNIIELKNDIKKLTEVKKPQILGPINTVFVPCE
jgi:hypothetical protein